MRVPTLGDGCLLRCVGCQSVGSASEAGKREGASRGGLVLGRRGEGRGVEDTRQDTWGRAHGESVTCHVEYGRRDLLELGS